MSKGIEHEGREPGNVFERGQAHRQERPALPFEMVREAVANALIHRDYSIDGAKCQIVVTEDTIAVQCPGKPPLPITLKQLQDFSAPMLSRNPELHFVFARIEHGGRARPRYSLASRSGSGHLSGQDVLVRTEKKGQQKIVTAK